MFKATLSNRVQILNFYQQLWTQGDDYGIRLVPLEQIISYGGLCPSDVPASNRHRMATTIYQKMQDSDCVSRTFTEAQHFIKQFASNSDGYKVLSQLLRLVHPVLNPSQVMPQVPRLSDTKDIFVYADHMRNYILLQRIQQRAYDDKEQSFLFLQYVDTIEYDTAKSRAVQEIISQTYRNAPIQDPNLLIDSLPITLQQYRSVTTPNQPITTGYSRALVASPECAFDQTTVVRSINAATDKRNAFRNKTQSQCKGCGQWAHTEHSCQFVAKLMIAQRFIAKYPNEAEKIAKEYRRVNDKKIRQYILRALSVTENISSDEMALAMNIYEAAIPMEEVNFSSDSD